MKQLTYGFALAVLAASMSTSVVAQTPAPGRPAAGGTIGTGPGYPTAEQYTNSKAAQALDRGLGFRLPHRDHGLGLARQQLLKRSGVE